MPFTRWQISSRYDVGTPARYAFLNTIYFNVSPVDPLDPIDWDSLGNDLWDVWRVKPWSLGRYLDIRGYDMGDAEPREHHYYKAGQNTGARVDGPGQIALCLSYFADRNLPRHRGRIYLGPWTTSGSQASDTQTTAAIGLAGDLAGLGGPNVDWSLWSPTTQEHTRITDAWVDDSWDVVRSRKDPQAAPRKTWSGNG